jgi:hypothetical protein
MRGSGRQFEMFKHDATPFTDQSQPEIRLAGNCVSPQAKWQQNGGITEVYRGQCAIGADKYKQMIAK